MRLAVLLVAPLVILGCGSDAERPSPERPARERPAPVKAPAPAEPRAKHRRPKPSPRPVAVRRPTAKEIEHIIAAAREDYAYQSSRPGREVRVHAIRVAGRLASAAVETTGPHAGALVLLFARYHPGRWGRFDYTATSFPPACAAAARPAVRALTCPDPWSVLGRAAPPVVLDRDVPPIPVRDLHEMKWRNATYPGAACGAENDIVLRDHGARIHPAGHPWWRYVAVGQAGRWYGDVDGDGRDEAAVSIVCSNDGGMAAGQLAFATVVFTAGDGTLRVLGVVEPRQPPDPDTTHAPIVARVKLRPGKVVAPEYWYGPKDGTCCSSGRATTVWSYAGGELRAGRTVVTREPDR
jgi:hypothetical protein